MIAHTNWVRAILAALAVGVLFVLTVRTVGLNELEQRGHCASVQEGLQLETCRGGGKAVDASE
ncbi:MAG: hypothetical protein JSR66_12515 [Proteobacteria bacterium]|nr:hypothetical protein [Pseudomonadota bacterium]